MINETILAIIIAFAIKSLNPNVKVYGVQAEGAASIYGSYGVG